MYIAPGQRQTAPRGQNLDVNRKALSLYPFVASFKEISLKSYFIQFFFHEISLKSYFIQFFFHDLIHVYSPRAGGHTASRGQSFYVNRNFFSLRSSVASFKSYTTINSEKSFVLSFSHTKAQGTNFDLVVK